MLCDLELVRSLAEAFFKVIKMAMGRRSFMWSGRLVCVEGFFGKDGREAFSSFMSCGMRGKLMKDAIDLRSKVWRHE